MNSQTVDFYSDKKYISQSKRETNQHPFLVKFRQGEFSKKFAKRIVAAQLRYNTIFILASAWMRVNFVCYPQFLCEFLDRHLATELGADLEIVGLKQSHKTHIQMIYQLANSLSMNQAEMNDWGPSMQIFLDQAILELMADTNLGRALGALYADEEFANVWFPIYDEGFKNFCVATKMELDLEFFDSHANEIEPAHVKHAERLFDFCLEMDLNQHDFIDGYQTFFQCLIRKFDGLHMEMLEEK